MTKNQKDGKVRRKELNRVAGEIGSIRSSLDDAYTQFNNTTDPDALDACIFEISALRSRYNTALKQYREWYY